MQRRGAIRATLETSGMIILYVIFLLVSAVFVLPLSLVQFALANRSAHHAQDHDLAVPRVGWMILLDVLTVVATYIIADILRCSWWMKVAWPEHVRGYGSTIGIHLGMLAVVALAWPSILHWLGWYKPRWRAWSWKVANTLAASVLLCMVMAAVALLSSGSTRVLFPRAQIGFVAALIPIVTGIIRGAAYWIGYTGLPETGKSTRLGPAW